MVPRIRDRRYEAIEFSPEEEAKRRASGDEYDRVVADVIEASRKAGQRPEGKPYRVFLLSPADDPETERLGAPIVNDLRASTGRGWGWTLHQRYHAPHLPAIRGDPDERTRCAREQQHAELAHSSRSAAVVASPRYAEPPRGASRSRRTASTRKGDSGEPRHGRFIGGRRVDRQRALFGRFQLDLGG